MIRGKIRTEAEFRVVTTTYTLLMSCEICLAHKFLLAVLVVAYMGICPTWVMGFHVCLEIVASSKEFSADVAFVICFIRGCKLSSLSDSGSVGNQRPGGLEFVLSVVVLICIFRRVFSGIGSRS
jgi:hypothetical protein